jgi:hypothetical protein
VKRILLVIALTAATATACTGSKITNDQYRNNAGDQDQTPTEYRALDRSD